MLEGNSEQGLQSTLELAFGFDSNELDLNRQGLLSERQINKLMLAKQGRAKGMFIGRLVFIFIVLMIVGFAIFILRASTVNNVDEIYMILGFSGLAIFILVLSLFYEFIESKPLMKGSVKNIDGVIKKAWTKVIGKHSLVLGDAYYVKIERKKCS